MVYTVRYMHEGLIVANFQAKTKDHGALSMVDSHWQVFTTKGGFWEWRIKNNYPS